MLGKLHSPNLFSRSVQSFFIIVSLILLFTSDHVRDACAEAKRDEVPDRFGLSVGAGRSFSPNGEMTFVNMTGISLIDFQRICLTGYLKISALRLSSARE